VDAGAEVREHTRLASLADAEGATVLVATDGYPSGLLGDVAGLIIPTRGQVIATEPLGERPYPLPHYARHGYDYWQSDEAGRLVVGGFRDLDLEAEYTAEEATTPRIQDALEASVEALLGFRPEIEYRWAGIFGTVADQLPLVGPVPGRYRVWVSAGYSGHGNVLGFLCGKLVAQAILGERDPLLDLLEPDRRVSP
jgi:glycine/D-amino acid oxidase-like deaminating enzyme